LQRRRWQKKTGGGGAPQIQEDERGQEERSKKNTKPRRKTKNYIYQGDRRERSTLRHSALWGQETSKKNGAREFGAHFAGEKKKMEEGKKGIVQYKAGHRIRN